MKSRADHLARVRRICLALPEAVEKTAWGAPTFRVGKGRIFAMFANDHHGDGRIALWMFARHDSQALLVESDPERFFVPPYVGKGGWIGIHVDRSPDALIADCVARAYCGVAPPPLRALAEGRLAGAPTSSSRRPAAPRPPRTRAPRARAAARPRAATPTRGKSPAPPRARRPTGRR